MTRVNRRTRLRWLLGGLAVLTATGTIGAALMPTLLAYSPLLLIALSPLPRHLVMAAPLVPIVPFVLVATLRRTLTSTLAYAIGRAYGEGGIAWVQARYPSLRGVLDWLQKAFDVAAPLVILVEPGPLIAALAGATRVPLPLFLPLAATGYALWSLLTYRVGEALRAWLAPLLKYFQGHVLSATLVCIVLVSGYALWRRRMRRRELLEAAAHALDGAPAEPNSLSQSATTGDCG
jgi:membrane protein DedA with SNARE-associated domain